MTTQLTLLRAAQLLEDYAGMLKRTYRNWENASPHDKAAYDECLSLATKLRLIAESA